MGICEKCGNETTGNYKLCFACNEYAKKKTEQSRNNYFADKLEFDKMQAEYFKKKLEFDREQLELNKKECAITNAIKIAEILDYKNKNDIYALIEQILIKLSSTKKENLNELKGVKAKL
jgi:hypothetical protein